MANYVVPGLGVEGVFKVSNEFSVDLIVGASYKLIAIRYLSDLVASGQNPFQDIYEPKGISNAKYVTDTNDNVCILSLQDASGNVVYIPNSYVLGYPDQGGVPYRIGMIAVRLGAIPDTLPLDLLMDQIKDFVMSKVGIEAQVKEVFVSTPTSVSQEDHANFEATRLARVTDNTTDTTKYLTEKARADALQTKVNVLEAALIAKG
jgi:hypothetical protein